MHSIWQIGGVLHRIKCIERSPARTGNYNVEIQLLLLYDSSAMHVSIVNGGVFVRACMRHVLVSGLRRRRTGGTLVVSGNIPGVVDEGILLGPLFPLVLFPECRITSLEAKH